MGRRILIQQVPAKAWRKVELLVVRAEVQIEEVRSSQPRRATRNWHWVWRIRVVGFVQQRMNACPLYTGGLIETHQT